MTTQNDKDVLNSILNPNLPLGEGVFDPEETAEEVVDEELSDERVKDLESEAVKTAEKGDIAKALELFDQVVHTKSPSQISQSLLFQIISLSPNRPASYNNRAQCLRLAGRPDAALLDLNKAVQLSGGGRGKAGSAALCQRGVLHRREGRDDDAVTDFKAAAEEGSGFAKTMLVEMNPYAAMCNAMLRNVFTSMAKGGDPESLMANNLKPNSNG